MDDIGRHNAVDKVIGWALKNERDLSQLWLITSGRVSSEILHKAARAGMAAIVARGAPTHQAVLRAKEAGITVIGFARGSGFTVYSGEERVKG
ncbi:MAG: formate dehydrogenase accessory sulfurtransferase FdhD [Lentisphaerae bacterium]|nr:formate dehydrogenase accessory sulfurtransferase FdhD [Lentisphaerota bacterium]